MRATALLAAGMVAFVLVLALHQIPWAALPVSAALFVAYLVLTAPDRRAARARKNHS